MEIEELKERYKVLPIWARLLTALVIGLLPAVYVYLDEGEALASRLDDAKLAESSARAKFESASKRKKNLPLLERDLVTAEEQLAQARKHLPNDFNVEGVLQKTATIAQEVGVSMRAFRPGRPQPGKGSYKYMEMAIKTEVEGKFAQLAAFYDRVAHLEGSVFMRNLTLESRLPELTKHAGTETQRMEKSPFELAKEARDKLTINGQFEIVVYRAMTDKEMAELNEGLEDAAESAGDAKQTPRDAPAAPQPDAGLGTDQGDATKLDPANGGAPDANNQG